MKEWRILINSNSNDHDNNEQDGTSQRRQFEDEPGARIAPLELDDEGHPVLVSRPDPAPWNTLIDMHLPRYVPFRAVLTPDQVASTHHMIIPRQMEDRWLLYRHGDRIRIHRSWTGFLIFEMVLRPTKRESYEGGEEVVGAWVDKYVSLGGPSIQELGGRIAGFIQWFFAGTTPNMADMTRLPPERVRELRRVHGDDFSQEVYDQELEKHREEMVEAWARMPDLGRLEWWMEVDDEEVDR